MTSEKQKLVFVIAPRGCPFHHSAAISKVLGCGDNMMLISTDHRQEIYGKLMGVKAPRICIFVHATAAEIRLAFNDAEIHAYYHACRVAGVSPFHTGTGQIIGPLNHDAGLAEVVRIPVAATVSEKVDLIAEEILQEYLQAGEAGRQPTNNYRKKLIRRAAEIIAEIEAIDRGDVQV